MKWFARFAFVGTLCSVGYISFVLGYIWEAVSNGFRSGREKFEDHGVEALRLIKKLNEPKETK